MTLSRKQTILLKAAEEYGYVTIKAANKVYDTKIHAKKALQKLCAQNYLEQNPHVFGRFDHVEKEGN